MERNTIITIVLAVLIVISLAQAFQLTSIAETPTSAVSTKTQQTPTQQTPLEPVTVQQQPQAVQPGCGY